MPTLRLTNLETYRNYFAALAASHVAVDGFKWGDKDVLRNDNRSDMPARVLWATPYERAQYTDRGSDNVVKTKVARVAYFVVPDSNVFADEDLAFDACEALVEQILARLLKDKAGEDDGEGGWTMIATDINTWSTGPVEMTVGSTRYIGYELQISFMDNVNLEYDVTKWA